MERKDAFKELARFAEARARGAAVVMGNGRRLDGTDGFTGLGVDANTFMSHTIKEIIEPKVLRDWTAEDAKRHVGYVFRITASPNVMCVLCPAHVGPSTKWTGCEYAAPIPGTDPAKWDWKPCKVEVPAEPVKSDDLRDALTYFVAERKEYRCPHAVAIYSKLAKMLKETK